MFECKHKHLSDVYNLQTTFKSYSAQKCKKCNKIFILTEIDLCNHNFIKIDKIKKEYVDVKKDLVHDIPFTGQYTYHSSPYINKRSFNFKV